MPASLRYQKQTGSTEGSSFDATTPTGYGRGHVTFGGLCAAHQAVDEFTVAKKYDHGYTVFEKRHKFIYAQQCCGGLRHLYIQRIGTDALGAVDRIPNDPGSAQGQSVLRA